MISSIAFVLLGIALLIAGGTALVHGASTLAARTGISPLVVGLTVVAFGTSAPELVVTVLGALQGHSNLAFGNVVGSNIANVGLVLGAAALFSPVVIQGQLIRREVPLLLLGTAVLVVMSLDSTLRGSEALLDRADGLILLLLFSIFIYVTVDDLRQGRQDPLLYGVQEALPLAVPGTPGNNRGSDLMWVAGGIIGLAIGGQLAISYGALLAEELEVSSVLIGLFVLAIGTSMPELVCSVIAAIRKESDLCIGNVLGSNLMNGLFILPAGALLSPIAVPPFGLFDLFVSFLFTAILIPVFIIGKSRLGRPAGSLLLLSYAGYLLLRTTLLA